MPPAGFEPTIPASERPQTHALDRAATGIGWDRTRTSAVRDRRLTTWAMARPAWSLKMGPLYSYCPDMWVTNYQHKLRNVSE